jgi:hypothetical protein
MTSGGTIVGHRWPAVWLVPALMAAAVAALLAVAFNPRRGSG